MKIYINNRDLLTWPREMATKLANEGHEVVFVDNASSYPPLLEWYNKCGLYVWRLVSNIGAYAPWTLRSIQHLTEPYVVTDPDLDISLVPVDWPSVLKEGLDRWTTHTKCALSLDDTGIPSANPASKADGFIYYPNGHPDRWRTEIEFEGSKCSYFGHNTDTTFALYRPGVLPKIDGMSAGRPYTARHLPWHLVRTLDPTDPAFQIPLNEELCYYFTHAASVVPGGYFSTTKDRMLTAGLV